jgi:putative RNA 2'-phosphotransferase
MGRRRDRKPVLLEIAASKASERGCSFLAFGDLFLAREIPADFISGPPVPKEPAKPPAEEKERKPTPEADFQAGTFLLDLSREQDPRKGAKGKKPRGWKEEARKMRKRRGK